MEELKKEILVKYSDTKKITYIQLIKLFKRFDVEINQFNFGKIYPFLESNKISLINEEDIKKRVLIK